MTTYHEAYSEITQSLQYSLDRQANQLDRLRAQLDFAHQLLAAHPDRASTWQPLILEAGRLIAAGMQQPQVDVTALTSEAEAVLSPIGRVAKSYTLLCVSHAHIDMNWQWSWPETVMVVNDTFQTMLALLQEFPDFIFSQSQASTYALIETHNPAMFAAIKERVKEGRWEVTASQWVEGDKNMASGESLCRHLLNTRAYFQEKFGLAPEDVQVDFEPDTFGHAATLPTILTRGGVKYYYHCRGSQGPHLYWWVGPDGSRILAFNDIKWYMDISRSKLVVGPQAIGTLVDFARATGMREMPLLYGVGDHGGGPTRRDLTGFQTMDTWPIFPNVKFSTLHHFFRLAEERAQDLPEIRGERNFVFQGCYTSQARQKWANRHGENLLYTAEVAATVGAQLADVAYPHATLEGAWRRLLFDQFHDILPGSGVRETRQYTMGQAQETQAAAAMARANALRGLSRRVNSAALREGFRQDRERDYKDMLASMRSQGAGVGNNAGTGGASGFSVTRTSDRAFLIFNPLPYPRTEIVETKLWDSVLNEDLLVVTTAEGDARRVQVLEKGRYWGHEYTTVAFPIEVPALGYRVVCISDRAPEFGLQKAPPDDLWTGTWGSSRKTFRDTYTLENALLRVRLDPGSGGIVELLDKRTSCRWVPEGKLMGTFQYCLEANRGTSSAWVIGQFTDVEDLLLGGTLRRLHHGPYVNTYRWTRQVNASTLTLDITVREFSPHVDFHLLVDWREMGHKERGIPHLRVRFPLAVDAPRPQYEIPFGALRRDLTHGEEVPALRWADVSGTDGAGVTLVNSSKYGHSVDGDTLALTLLRATIAPDPLPDLGEHVIEYALVPHGQDWTAGDAMREGETFNVPLVVKSCDFQEGDLPPVLSLISVAPGNVRLTALKQAKNGEGMVLRLVEVEGEATEACISFAPELLPEGATVLTVDTLERALPKNDAHLEENALTVTVPAFGIVSLRLGCV